MKRLSLFILAAGVAAFLLGHSGQVQAIQIVYEATDLTDINPGEDLWEYNYSVSDHSFAMDEGFTIYFDYKDYGFLDPFPTPPNMDWDVITWDPDPALPDDGAYDALAWVDNASLDDPFTVSFTWLGSGTPGAQPCELYTYDWATGAVNIIGDGNTAPVPEPATMFLMGTGLLGLAGFKKKFKRT